MRNLLIFSVNLSWRNPRLVLWAKGWSRTPTFIITTSLHIGDTKTIMMVSLAPRKLTSMKFKVVLS